ncbi:hypothetical protein EG327_011374 [Venturia inaequalis]|uniref:Uncharacterized protein n=1 Tax=Venturia inaequalis TaxID=5025 RepID=A0A8H3UE95_VENIN|nr:hypothetical protein EG327_011374 [Venturia inaequalis]
MQFSTIFSIGLVATSAMAAPAVSRRGLTDVTAAFEKIEANIATMVAKVKAWDGQASSIAPVLEESGKLTATIKAQTAAIAGTGSIGITDAVGVAGPVNTLSAKVDDIVNALTSKKAQFDTAKLTSKVSGELTNDLTATKELIKTIVGKLPSIAVPIAQPLADGITTKLDKAVTTFSK